MQKRMLYRFIGFIVLILVLWLFKQYFTNVNEFTSDSVAFKNEYENLNGEESSSGYTYMALSLPDTKNVKYATQDDVVNMLTNGTGIIYFGFPECPWCRNIITPLLEVVNDNGLSLLYYNNKEDRDIKELDDNGNIITTKEGSDDYYEIVDLLSDYLGEYKGLSDESIKRLYYPTVVFVDHGEIKGVHIGTVESHTVGTNELTIQQKDELKDIYQNYIDITFNGYCDESC